MVEMIDEKEFKVRLRVIQDSKMKQVFLDFTLFSIISNQRTLLIHHFIRILSPHFK